MTLEKYLKDREKWQESTIEHIRDKILLKSKNVVKSLDSEKLVAIYGPPQIGKTSLILFLLGIDAKYQKEVYHTLRAGVPRGNSSTSTAIMYQKSETEDYGVKYGEGISEIEYCSEKHLKQKIQDVRKSVENEEASKDILHIYIPRRFFNEQYMNCSGINIVDLPGDGSRNIKEKVHVDAMINKYMALATINIITCKANEINSLRELELPINVDWQNLPHKYIVVITNAYGQGTIKKYFKIKKSERRVSFLDYVINEYSENLKPILNPLSKIEFFPIDIGDSLERLTKKSGLDGNDSLEIITTTYEMANRIRNSIQKRHGNSLKNTIMDLKAYSLEYAEHKSTELSRKIEEIKDYIDYFAEEIKIKEKIVEEAGSKLIEMQETYDDYIQLKKTIVFIDISETFNTMVHFLEALSINRKIKDDTRQILSRMNAELISFIESCFAEYGIDNSFVKCLTTYEKINSDINLEAELVDKFYKGGLFSKKIKVDEMIDTLNQLFEMFQERLLNFINSIVKKQIFNKGYIEVEYQRYRQWKIQSARDIEHYRNRIDVLRGKKFLLEEERSTILLRKADDLKLINDYLQIAKVEFEKYRKELEQKMYSAEYSVEEKVCILIYLCLLEKDYQSIVEMG